MRSDFPPGGKRVGDWVGLQVRSRVALRNGNNELPAGAHYRVTYARSGLTLHSEPCPCCGATQFIRRVHPRDVEAIGPAHRQGDGSSSAATAPFAAGMLARLSDQQLRELWREVAATAPGNAEEAAMVFYRRATAAGVPAEAHK